MKPYPPAHGSASTNARLDAPARRQFQGAAPHEPLFVERWAFETKGQLARGETSHSDHQPTWVIEEAVRFQGGRTHWLATTLGDLSVSTAEAAGLVRTC
jgi:hypothetical protein